MQKKIELQSDGLTLSGILHVPDDLATGEKRAAFAILHGFGGSKDVTEHRRQAEILEQWGYVALRFDMRGCGQSEGLRGNLIFDEQVRDAITAFEFLAAYEAVNPDCIGLYGDSMGGGVSVIAAAEDKRIAAVICNGAFGDGSRQNRNMHSPQAFNALLDKMKEARRLKHEGGQTMTMHRFDIVPVPMELRGHLGTAALMEFTMDTVQGLHDVRPEDYVARIAPRPLLIVHPASDQMVPATEAMELFKRAGQPTELYLVAGEDHFPLSGKNPKLPLIIKMWLDRFLPAKQ
jgi:fermentation-respiration switch protein FrsA (DUF1100 family)